VTVTAAQLIEGLQGCPPDAPVAFIVDQRGLPDDALRRSTAAVEGFKLDTTARVLPPEPGDPLAIIVLTYR
jgi:hypothetical protein